MWKSEKNIERLLCISYRLSRTPNDLFMAEMDMEPFEYQLQSIHFFIPVTMQSLIDLSLVMYQGSDGNFYMQMNNDIPYLEANAFTTSSGDERFYFTEEQKQLFREENPINDDYQLSYIGEARLLTTSQVDTYFKYISVVW